MAGLVFDPQFCILQVNGFSVESLSEDSFNIEFDDEKAELMKSSNSVDFVVVHNPGAHTASATIPLMVGSDTNNRFNSMWPQLLGSTTVLYPFIYKDNNTGTVASGRVYCKKPPALSGKADSRDWELQFVEMNVRYAGVSN